MAPREPTNAQISSRLSYSQNTPSFLLKLQNRVAGIPDEPGQDEYDDEYYNDGSGRPPIPQRPAVPERPEGDIGSADEDDGDEKPQVVVLKQGKHLTEREAENERRKEKGLPPLPDPALPLSDDPSTGKGESTSKTKAQAPSLSFSSSKSGYSKTTIGKRKAIGDADGDNTETKSKKVSKKKAKKAGKTLLSFGDDEP